MNIWKILRIRRNTAKRIQLSNLSLRVAQLMHRYFLRHQKKFGVELSILTSQIDYAGGVKFGFTIAEVEGDEDAITQAKVYLMENNVRVEVLGYVQ